MVENSKPTCQATRKDGQPCTALARASGLCFGYDPTMAEERQEARRRGGENKATSRRMGKLIPTRLRPVANQLETALQEVRDGTISPQQAQAMASLASALVKVITAGEFEERIRRLEGRFEPK